MRKVIMMAVAMTMTACVSAQDTIQLPEVDKSNSMTLMEALQQRHSSREFSDKEISNEVLAQVMWAACGVNRPEEKKITVPSAVNAQDIVLFVCGKDGAYEYLPETHQLRKVSDKDLRQAVAGPQGFAAIAPVSIVIASNHGKFRTQDNGTIRTGAIDSGYVSENISLICTALGLKTVPRMTMDAGTLRKELGLTDLYDLLLNHPIGY